MHPDYSTGCYSSHCIFILISVFRCSRCDFEPNDQPWRTEPLSWDTASQTLLKLRNLLTDKFQLMDQFKQNRPMPHTQSYMDADILASAHNEPPWVIMRIFIGYSDSRAIPKRKVENERPKPDTWKTEYWKWKTKNRKTEKFESNIKLTRLILHWLLQQIFSHQDLWRAGTTTENLQTTPKSNIKILFTIALHFYRDITNKTPMELNPVYFIFL